MDGNKLYSSFTTMLKGVTLTWIKILVYCSFSLHIKASLTSNEEEFLTERLKRKVNEVAGFDLNDADMAKFHIWPLGIIQYYIDDFSFDKVLRDRIRVFLHNVNSLTGLRFLEIPMPPEDDKTRWVFFLNRKGLLGCADHPFKKFTTEGVQRIVLGYHCINKDEDLADVILSLVGVPPQHNCPDRDKYITVMKENIRPDKLYLFEKLKDSEWIFHDLDYDFLSAGHYGNYKHNFNGSATLITTKSLRTVTGNENNLKTVEGNCKEKGFSYNDILKIKMLYNYISRNRESSLKVPECSKLFDPNSNLPQHLVVITKKEVKPRPKPSRYLKESTIETNVSNEAENVDNLSYDNDKISKKDISKDDENNYEETDRQNNSENDENNDNNKNYTQDNSKHSNQDNDYNNSKENDTDEEDNYNEDSNRNFTEDNIKHNNQNDNDYNNSKENDTDEDENYNEDNKKENGKKPNENKEPKADSKTEENSNDIDNIKALESSTNNEKKADKKSEITYKINTLEGYTNKNLNNKLHFTDTTRNHNRAVMALVKKKFNTQKLLVQSDYETGDEGDKKYIHEKSF